MFEITKKSEIVKLTPKRAQALREINSYKGQRAVRVGHVKKLAEHIKTGDFLVGEIAVAHNGDGSKFLANGQHQCEAVIMAKKSIDVTWTEYHCPTSADAVRLFSLFDNNKSRSFPDTVNVQIAAADLHWKRKTATAFARALNRLEFDGDRVVYLPAPIKGDKYERASIVLEHLEAGHFIDEMVKEKKSGILRKVPVVQLMIATFYKNEEDCFRFWEGIKTGAFPLRDDPRIPYRDFLKEAIVGNSSMSFRYNPREIIYRGALTWNNYRKGNSRKNLAQYRPGREIPDLI